MHAFISIAKSSVHHLATVYPTARSSSTLQSTHTLPPYPTTASHPHSLPHPLPPSPDPTLHIRQHQPKNTNHERAHRKLILIPPRLTSQARQLSIVTDLALKGPERETAGEEFFDEERVHGGLVGAAADVRAEGAEGVAEEEEVALGREKEEC